MHIQQVSYVLDTEDFLFRTRKKKRKLIGGSYACHDEANLSNVNSLNKAVL